jgi:hypothetical protein
MSFTRDTLFNILNYRISFFQLFLLGSILGLIANLAWLPHLLGHDIYFHFHVSTMILNNNLNLPVTLPYYWVDFFFGYPFFYHWLAAVISYLSGISLQHVFIWSPIILLPLILILLKHLYQFYLKENAAIPVYLYVILSFDLLWPLYAGEYPRLLSICFMLSALICIVHYQKSGALKWLLFAGITSGAALMSNLIADLFLIPLLFFLSIEHTILNRNIKFLIVPVLAVIVSSWWWLRAAYLFEPNYFFEVMSIHQKAFPTLVIAILMTALLGIYTVKKWRMPSVFAPWLILSLATQGTPYLAIPVVFYIVKYLSRLIMFDYKVKFSLALLALIVLMFNTSGAYFFNESYVNKEVVEAGTWIQENTLESDSIIAFGSVDMSSVDRLNELAKNVTGMYRDETLPFLADRRTYTWFGYEWSLTPQRYPIYRELHRSMCSDHLLYKSQLYDVYPTIVWINKDSKDYTNWPSNCASFDETTFSKIYENERIILYRIDWEMLVQ